MRARFRLALNTRTRRLGLTLVCVFLITACARSGTPDTPPPSAPVRDATVTDAPPAAAPATSGPPTDLPAAEISTPTAIPTPAAANPVDFAPLVAVIEQEMAAQQVPGLAVAVIHQGDTLFSQGFGVADVNTGRAVTPATPFRIGSITKPLTAIGLLQLVDAGQVDLDAPVVSYVPEFVVNDQITVRQLLSHHSGLGDSAIPFGRTDATALRDFVATLTPDSAFAAPGEIFSYSNTGFNVAGHIIERVSGMAYADYMTSHVFPALGMRHTTFDRATALAAGLALGYYPGRDAPTVVDRDPDNGAEYPSGFAFSTVEDLTRLAHFLLNDGMLAGEQLLSPARVQAMSQPAVMVEPLGVGYGLGLMIRTKDGHTTIGHNGTINGYAATLQMIPSQALAVIVLSNRHNYDPARITNVAFELLGEQAPAPPAPALDSVSLSAYPGRYLFPNALPGQEAEVVLVALQDGQLTASLPGVIFQMRPIGPDLFDLYVPEQTAPVNQLAFVRDAAGSIRYMHFTLHALARHDR